MTSSIAYLKEDYIDFGLKKKGSEIIVDAA